MAVWAQDQLYQRTNSKCCWQGEQTPWPSLPWRAREKPRKVSDCYLQVMFCCSPCCTLHFKPPRTCVISWLGDGLNVIGATALVITALDLVWLGIVPLDSCVVTAKQGRSRLFVWCWCSQSRSDHKHAAAMRSVSLGARENFLKLDTQKSLLRFFFFFLTEAETDRQFQE